MPKAGDIDYTRVVELNLPSVAPSLAGPKRPQDRIEIGNVKANFAELFAKPTSENGFNKNPDDLAKVYETTNGVKFPMFAKSVVSGPAPNPLYVDLIKQTGKTPACCFMSSRA